MSVVGGVYSTTPAALSALPVLRATSRHSTSDRATVFLGNRDLRPFTKLQKVKMCGHNPSFADEATLKASITPALEVFEVLDDNSANFRPAPKDDDVGRNCDSS